MIAATRTAAIAIWPSGVDSPVGSAAANGIRRGYRRRVRAASAVRRRLDPMRTTVFRAMMAEEFGPVRAAAIARDHVFAELDGGTVDHALAAGRAPKEIWLAVCAAFDVPPERR